MSQNLAVRVAHLIVQRGKVCDTFVELLAPLEKLRSASLNLLFPMACGFASSSAGQRVPTAGGSCPVTLLQFRRALEKPPELPPIVSGRATEKFDRPQAGATPFRLRENLLAAAGPRQYRRRIRWWRGRRETVRAKRAPQRSRHGHLQPLSREKDDKGSARVLSEVGLPDIGRQSCARRPMPPGSRGKRRAGSRPRQSGRDQAPAFSRCGEGNQIGVIETLLNSKRNQNSFQFDGCFPCLSFKTGSFREGRAVIIVVSETKFAHRRASGDARGYSQGVKPRKSRSPLEMRTGTRRALQFLIVQPFSMAGEGRNPAHWRQIF